MGKDVKQEDIIYTAGFFDGEGYFGIGYGGRIEIRIVNTDKNIIKYLHDLWGGIVYKRKKGKNNKLAYDLVIVGKLDVDNFLDTIYPFLKVKKQEIDRVLRIKKIVDRLKKI